MNYNYDHIEELKEFREYMRYTQEQLAAECEFPVSLIRRIEQDKKSIFDLSLRQFNRIAKVIFEYDENLSKHFVEIYSFTGYSTFNFY